jgi:hypothetical protein
MAPGVLLEPSSGRGSVTRDVEVKLAEDSVITLRANSANSHAICNAFVSPLPEPLDSHSNYKAQVRSLSLVPRIRPTLPHHRGMPNIQRGGKLEPDFVGPVLFIVLCRIPRKSRLHLLDVGLVPEVIEHPDLTADQIRGSRIEFA